MQNQAHQGSRHRRGADRSVYAGRGFFFAVVAVLVSACALPPPSDPVMEKRAENMSKQAFDSILPELQKLQPGDDIKSFLHKRTKTLRETSPSGEFVEGHFFIEGWIGGMSGGSTRYPLGLDFAHTEETVRGRHVFGYVWGGMNLTPQFLIITEATIIEKAEYDNLCRPTCWEAGRIGKFPYGSGWRYYRDLRVAETRPLPFVGHPDVAAAVAAGEISIEPTDDLAEGLYSERAFREAEKKLHELPLGTDFWGMVSELGGYFITRDYGRNWAVFLNAFRGDQSRLIDTDEAEYMLRPFGYEENGRWTPKVIAIFRNDRLEKVVPHTGIEDWSGYLAE